MNICATINAISLRLNERMLLKSGDVLLPIVSYILSRALSIVTSLNAI